VASQEKNLSYSIDAVLAAKERDHRARVEDKITTGIRGRDLPVSGS